MEGNKNRWFIKRDHYLNMDTYNVCMEPADKRLPVVCIGNYQGIRELEKFAAMLEAQLEHRAEMNPETVDSYEQIVEAIRQEAREHG